MVILLSIVVYGYAQIASYNTGEGEYKRKNSERVYIVGQVVNIAYELQVCYVYQPFVILTVQTKITLKML